MKKRISILSILIAMFLIHNTAYAAESDDPELYKFASSLGADTDYLAVVNYKHDDEHPFNSECYIDYLHNCNSISPLSISSFSDAVSGGACLGISALEVLAHNGIIKPSDIQEGAVTMSEISYSENVDRYITDYQAVQEYTEFSLFEKYLISSMTYNEGIAHLISTGEKCINNNKYFLVIIRDENFSHAVCGIGITDGNWTFNDITYDKCVLLLDSNLVNTEGIAKGFSNQTCIYINSQTNQCCIPAYDKYSDDDPSLKISAINDDTLLNYRGILNKTEAIETDITRIKEFMYKPTNSIIVTPIDENGTQLQLPEDSFAASWGKIYKYFESDSVRIDLENEEESQILAYRNLERNISISLYHPYSAYSNCNIDLNDSEVVINNNDSKPIMTTLHMQMEKGSYSFAPYYAWYIEGQVLDNLSVVIQDKGMLFKTNNNIDMLILPYYYILNKDGFIQSSMNLYYPDHKYAYLCTRNNVLISVDESKNIRYYIDNNDDEVYDVPVEIGDINCDGKIDSSDASQVLSIYSILSTKNYAREVDYSLGDYNGDGKVNSIDASDLLAEYGRLSTS